MAERPSGTVTFLFTDIEGSTAAWENDPTAMAADLEIHDRILRETIESNGGFVFATGGDSFSAAFSSPTMALWAAVEAQRGLTESGCGLRVRMGVHSGEAVERDGNYFGPALNRTARLMSIGHGGQILVSEITKGLMSDGEFSFVDLGEHRLADLSTPSRVTQVVADGLDDEFPPLRSVVATDNLPRLGEVFGRDSDIENLATLVADHQLVTLTGAGGIGKTTLAIVLARQVNDPFPDGRWLIDLTDLPARSDFAAVSGQVAAVDNRFNSIEALAPRQMLMILDNCEHVLDGVRSYVADVIVTAPQVKVLATSREPLGIRRERVVPLEPLSVEEGSGDVSAVDLFIERATEAGVTLDLDTDRDAVTAICKKVSGLPLAIELAAARTAIMTPNQILDRLADRLSLLRGGVSGPEHHHTIEATIAWSYDLLDEGTQKLLRIMSVFEAGFDLDQAEAVGGDGAVGRLADLVKKSLVTRHGGRFGMLEAVRQYATARLNENGEEEGARQRHFDLFADWADEVYHRDTRIALDPDEIYWATVNLANLHRAIGWGAAHQGEVQAAKIAVVLWPHYIDSRYGQPTDDWFEPLIPCLDDLDPQLQMGVLHGSGAIRAWHLGDLDYSERLHLAEHKIFERTGVVPPTGVTAHNPLAIAALQKGHWDEAIRWHRSGINALGEAGKANSGNLARAIFDTYRDAEQALAILDDADTVSHLTTTAQVAANTLLRAEMHWRLGNLDQAQALINDTLPTLRQAHMRQDLLAIALCTLGHIEDDRGHPDLAASLYLEAIDIESTNNLVDKLRDGWPSIYLAHLLIDLGHPKIAALVVDNYRTAAIFIPPTHEADLEAVEARIAAVIDDWPRKRDDRDLDDAIRQALESASPPTKH